MTSNTLGWSRTLVAGALFATVLTAPPAGAQDGRDPGFRTLDDEYAELADRIPGFGGLFLDEAGHAHVYLTDVSRGREVQELAAGGVQVHRGDYDFRSLAGWKSRLLPLLDLPGAVFLDADERSNRLVLGVEGGTNERVEAALRESGVPRAAVVVEDSEPIAPMAELTDQFRPIPAGVQIRNQDGGGCTLGINAMGATGRGFVTASHCSLLQFVLDGTVFFQRSVAPGNRVGVEVTDPPFFAGGSCPSGRLCRYSDASFVDYDSDSLPQMSLIANPSYCALDVGSRTVLPALPRLTLDGTVPTTLPSGAVVQKVGKTTGCTLGSVKSSCFDANVKDTVFTLKCQTRVSSGAQGGDSGSPVFQQHGAEATLAGILWGGTSNTFVYSPWIWVQSELGVNVVIP